MSVASGSVPAEEPGRTRRRDPLTIGLEAAGTAMVWAPFVASVLFSLARKVSGGPWRLDFLMPAELAPLALSGGAILAWAAAREKRLRGAVWGALGAAVAMLAATQVLAVVTGLASGRTEPAGAPLASVAGALVAYALALVVLGVCGVLLLAGRRAVSSDDVDAPAR